MNDTQTAIVHLARRKSEMNSSWARIEMFGPHEERKPACYGDRFGSPAGHVWLRILDFIQRKFLVSNDDLTSPAVIQTEN
mmetsp:Transcript_34845/g.86672  ORF Transcript_34845/g.86672 Transcript_34845/m.86672 type:complete len:80 (-) Transcript_34845:308-547(-)